MSDDNEESVQPTHSERTTANIIEGLNDGTLETESIRNQKLVIMKRLEETVNAAQERIKSSNAQIKGTFIQLDKISNTIRTFVKKSNDILEGNKELIDKAINATEQDMNYFKKESDLYKLSNLLRSLKEYNRQKISDFNQIGNTYMRLMRDVYIMAGIGKDTIKVPEREITSYPVENEGDNTPGYLSSLFNYYSRGGSFDMKKTSDVIKKIHEELRKRKEIIGEITASVKIVASKMQHIIREIDITRIKEKDVVLKYLNSLKDQGALEKNLAELYKIPLRSTSQISDNFKILVDGMLVLASETGDPSPAPATAPSAAPEAKVEEVIEDPNYQPPSFWSNLGNIGSTIGRLGSTIGNVGSTIYSAIAPGEAESAPIKREGRQDNQEQESTVKTDTVPDSISKIEPSVPERIGDESVKEEIEEILDATSEELDEEDCKEYIIKIENLQKTERYKMVDKRSTQSKRNLTRKLSKLKSQCGDRRVSSRITPSRGGYSQNKTLKNRQWYIRKAKNYVKGKRKYPSRS